MAQPADDDALVEMCLQLYSEDPGPSAVPAEHMRATVAALRREPWRGRAVVLEIEERLSGYGLLIAYWSNEFGGDVCAVDELFVAPQHRSKGYAKLLFATITKGDLWPTHFVAIALGATLGNVRARRLYESLGFATIGVSMVRRLP